jgi:uncharacterized membrane protein YbhN (UPF0104 family)
MPFQLRTIRQALSWCLPPILLFIVFQKIDLDRLGQVLARADVLLLLAGVLPAALVVLAGALRWQLLLRHCVCASLPFTVAAGEYWKSLAVGVLVPGSVGSDAYRVIVAGRCQGAYLRSAVIVGVEKLVALLTCLALLAVLYPLLAWERVPGEIAPFMHGVYGLLCLIGGLVLVLLLLGRSRWLHRFAIMCGTRLEAMARRLTRAAGQPGWDEWLPGSGLGLLRTVVAPRVALPVAFLSLVVYLVSALQAQVYFQGLGCEISFAINLFVTPLVYLLISLPVTFGGVGIREGAYVLLYGAFGVPAETALVVSFCSLLALLFSYGVGAILFFFDGRRPDALSAGSREKDTTPQAPRAESDHSL